MGYNLSQNAYLCFEPSTRRTITSRHVIFHEGSFPFHQPDHNSAFPSPSAKLQQRSSVMISLPKLSFASPSPALLRMWVLQSCHHLSGSPSAPTPLQVSTPSSPLLLNPNTSIELPAPTVSENTEVRVHRMTTRSMNDIYKPKNPSLLPNILSPFPRNPRVLLQHLLIPDGVKPCPQN